MSAICGIYNRNKTSLSPNTLDKMMNAIAYYGQDGRNSYIFNSVAVGHLTTYNSPESLTEKLPSKSSNFSKTQGLIITADARLDNRLELFRALNIPHTEHAKFPDSQIILHAYMKWGEHCPEKLLGDFAFAIWDQHKQHFFCARDYPGVKPFYYHANVYRFAFASDLDALLANPDIPQNFDYKYLAAHLRTPTSFPHFERTFFADVQKLSPAHAMLVSADDIKIWAYWRAGQTPKIQYKNDDDYIEHFTELYQKAISCRVRSSFPLGAHLSGGLDSSSVAVLASRALKKEGRNLTGGFSWSPELAQGTNYIEHDERQRVNSICKQENFPPYFVNSNAQDILFHISEKQTIPMSTTFYETNVCQQAKELGIRTLLSGWGGDELIAFNGRGFFLEMFRHGRWRTCFHELRMHTTLNGIRFRRGFLHKLVFPWLPDEAIIRLYPNGLLAESRKQLGKASLPTVLKNEFKTHLENAANFQTDIINERLGVRSYQLTLLSHGHLTHRIEGWAKLGAKYGVQYAYPLLDRRIIEFALSIPPDMFVKTGWKRWLFRQSLKDILPEPMRWNKNKIDPAIKGNTEKRKTLMRKQVVPQLNKVLNKWIDSSQEFKILNPAMVQQALSRLLKENSNKYDKLFQALRIEQLVNPELAEYIQEHIAEEYASA